MTISRLRGTMFFVLSENPKPYIITETITCLIKRIVKRIAFDRITFFQLKKIYNKSLELKVKL